MVSVTPRAQEKLKEVLHSNGAPEASVRIAVVRGPHGCIHGWQLAIERDTNADDVVLGAGAVQIVVQPDLVEILSGASIDYLEDARNIGFTIDAPNTSSPAHEQGGGCCH